MSRSRKKTPIMGITKASSDAWYKKYLHGKRRAKVRGLIYWGDFDGAETDIPYDWWETEKDGRQYFDPRKHPEWMRK